LQPPDRRVSDDCTPQVAVAGRRRSPGNAHSLLQSTPRLPPSVAPLAAVLLTRSTSPARVRLSVVAHDVTILVTNPLAGCAAPSESSDRFSSLMWLAAPLAGAIVDSPGIPATFCSGFPD